MKYEEILSRFRVKQRSGDRAMCLCPAHEDREASLSVSRGAEGRTLIHCFAGCSPEAVAGAAGLTLADLMDGAASGERWKRFVERREGKRIEAVYDYTDPVTGEYRFSRLRLSGKAFLYGILRDGQFIRGLEGRKRREIPAVFTKCARTLRETANAGGRVFYAEGEKDVLTLQAQGYTAFTCGASGDWDPACAFLAEGADLVICGDSDAPGRELADRVRTDLKKTAARVRVVFPDRSREGGDVSSFFEDGHSREELEALISAAGEGSPEEADPLRALHLYNSGGQVTGVYDYAVFRRVAAETPLFMLEEVPYLYEDGVFRPDWNGAALKTRIRENIYPEFIKSTVIQRIYGLFPAAAELRVSYDQVNAYPRHWINFRNGFYDPVEKRLIPHDPGYRAINGIPHVYDPAHPAQGPAVEEWLRFIVPEERDREMLLQYAGLCMTRDCRQQKFLILCGRGGTGKSTLIRLIEKAVGAENTSNVSLEELSERFGTWGLMGRLLNTCADLKTGALEDPSVLKKILGEDTLRVERKGHDAFSFRSSARLLFSTNELPLIRGEYSDGFYRRMLVLGMNRVPETERKDLFERLEAETDCFIRLCVEAVERMYASGSIAESPSSREAVAALRRDSDTVEAFLRERTCPGEDLRTERGALYDAYAASCLETDREILPRYGFYRALRTKGYGERNSGGKRYILGLGL